MNAFVFAVFFVIFAIGSPQSAKESRLLKQENLRLLKAIKALSKTQSALSQESKVGATGKVKWFIESKGVGLLTEDSEDGKPGEGPDSDVFVDWRRLRRLGQIQTLTKGQRVRFDKVKLPMGPQQAINVEIIDN